MILRRAFVRAFAFFVFFVPVFLFSYSGVYAADFLVPCGGPGQDACGLCELVKLGDNILDFIITTSALVAALLFAYAGVLLVTAGAKSSNVSKAKSIFSSVAIGFIIILSAWLVVDVILSVLTGKGLGPTSDILCSLPDSSAASVDRREAFSDVATGSTPPLTTTSTAEYNHSEALRALEQSGVVVTSTSGPGGVRASCPGSGGCTSLQGVKRTTIAQIQQIASTCGAGCDLVVTGATEAGHATGDLSHGAGYKIDLDDNPSTNTFFSSLVRTSTNPDGALQETSPRGGDPRYVDSCGNEYVREGTHWDITVVQVCALN